MNIIKDLDVSYICPMCKKQHERWDSVIMTEATDVHQNIHWGEGRTFTGRPAMGTLHTSYRIQNVRFCPACAKKRKRTRNAILIFVLILPLVMTFISPYIHIDGKPFLGEHDSFWGVLFCWFCLFAIIGGIIHSTVERFIFKLDTFTLIRYNALVLPGEEDN